jgi:hypothetical protein
MSKPANKGSAQAARQARLAAQLRANLKKRKELARTLSGVPSQTDPSLKEKDKPVSDNHDR